MNFDRNHFLGINVKERKKVKHPSKHLYEEKSFDFCKSRYDVLREESDSNVRVDVIMNVRSNGMTYRHTESEPVSLLVVASATK